MQVPVTNEQAELVRALVQQQAMANTALNSALLGILSGHGVTQFKNVQLIGQQLTYELVE